VRLSRSSAGRGRLARARVLASPSTDMPASTASMPSMLVPDISPTNRREVRATSWRLPEAGELELAHVLEAFQVLRRERSEAGQGGPAERRGDREVGLERVRMLAGDAELVVQVRAGREAGAADVADDRALGDLVALAQVAREAAHVGVQGRILAVVLDDHDPAVATLGADELDHPVAGGADRGARRGGEVDALVRPDLAQDRMQPGVGEARADAGELDRVAQEGLAEAVAVDVVVLAAVAAVVEPERGELPLAVDVAHREHAAPLGQLEAVGLGQGLVDDFEAVAAAQVAVEVELAAEDVGDLARHGVGDPGGVGGAEQGARDGGGAQGDAVLELDGLVAGGEPPVRAALDHDAQADGRLLRIDDALRIHEAGDLPHGIELGMERLAGAEREDGPGGAVLSDELDQPGIDDVHSREHRLQGVAEPDAGALDAARRG